MWVLVTGGAKRIGRAIALYLAQEGYSICIHYNKSEREAKELALQMQGSTTIQGDFSTLTGIEDFIKRYRDLVPKTYALIHNVGNYVQAPLLRTDINTWQELYFNNVTLPFYLSQGLLPTLEGSIIHLGVCGLNRSHVDKRAPAYMICKEALFSLTKTLAKELAPAKINVNMVSPGYTEISMPQEVRKLPFQRVAKEEEIARVIAFLIDPQNRYVTGQNIDVAGGVRL